MFENIKDKFPIYKKSPELVFLDTAASALKPIDMINTIKNHSKDKDRVLKAISIIKEVGGVDYASNKMEMYKDNAIKILDDFSTSPFKDSLILLANFVTSRDV